MMKEEFENGIGYRVSQEIYNDVEFVYMNDDRFVRPQDMIDYWKEHDYGGRNGIHGLKCAIIEKQEKEAAIKEGRAKFRWDCRYRCLRMEVA